MGGAVDGLMLSCKRPHLPMPKWHGVRSQLDPVQAPARLFLIVGWGIVGA